MELTLPETHPILPSCIDILLARDNVPSRRDIAGEVVVRAMIPGELMTERAHSHGTLKKKGIMRHTGNVRVHAGTRRSESVGTF